MVEIRFGDQYEITDLAGQTVSEAREHFRSEFGIPDKAKARLNGSKVKESAELDTVLNDDDKLTFAVSRGKGAYLVGALLLALAVTGSVFAYGWINSTTTISATTTNYNFADVSVNNTVAGWTAHGFFKGSISSGELFNVQPVVAVPIDDDRTFARVFCQMVVDPMAGVEGVPVPNTHESAAAA